MSMAIAMNMVVQERLRQNKLVEEGKLPFNCAEVKVADLLKLPVLGEEFGEVCKEIYELQAFFGRPDDKVLKLRTELVQLAAVAVSWVEALIEESEEAAVLTGSDPTDTSDDPMRLAQKLLKDGRLQRVPPYLVGQLKERLEDFNRQKNEWRNK